MNTLTKLFSNESITLISVIAIILLAALSVFIFIKRPNKLGKTVLWFMIPVFVIGILLHYMGLDFCDGETPWHYKLLSSIISGFRMFGFYLSSSAVEDLVIDKVDKYGNVQRIANPYLKIRKESKAEFNQSASRLGLEPSSRSAIASAQIQNVSEQSTPLMQILNGLNK